ncbi:hypothetical protein BJY04DRAFT_219693 [Aspergillus karnatakaensis]|uniref:uncharacterized protein n=1 Tax=Aspergillus karnatakaensis TaxID=1810916 RepID=UPI003CCE2801
MTEPIGVTSGTLTVLETVRQLYNFIESIIDAPNVLARAKVDLRMTVEVLEDMSQYVAGRGTKTQNQDAPLSSVLAECLLKCNALRLLLHDLVKKTGGLSILDRTRLALKEDSIEKLRNDISSARECLVVALSSLILTASTNSYEAIMDYQQQASSATDKIKQRMEEIQVAMRVLGTQIGEDVRKSLIEETLTLKERLRLCEESVNLIQDHAKYKSVVGDIKSGEAARAFAGVATNRLQGGVDQTFGDSDLGPRSITFMGAGDTDAVLGFFQHAGEQARSALDSGDQPANLPRLGVVFPQLQSPSTGPWQATQLSLPEHTATSQYVVERVSSSDIHDRREKSESRKKHH